MDSSNVGVAEKNDNGAVSLREWQEWGTSSLVPVSVAKLASDLKTLEKESGAPMVFGGLGGKLQVSRFLLLFFLRFYGGLGFTFLNNQILLVLIWIWIKFHFSG